MMTGQPLACHLKDFVGTYLYIFFLEVVVLVYSCWLLLGSNNEYEFEHPMGNQKLAINKLDALDQGRLEVEYQFNLPPPLPEVYLSIFLNNVSLPSLMRIMMDLNFNYVHVLVGWCLHW